MSKKWYFILIAIVLVFSLVACTGATDPQTSPAGDTDTDLAQGHDDDTDADTGTDTDADHDSEMEEIDAASIYSQRCSGCHGENREGDNGPPLLPANLTKDSSAYVETITKGSGPMPAWDGRLSVDEISALADFILSDPE